MNLTGIMPRMSYAVEIQQPESTFKDVVNGSKLAFALREMRGTLQRNGFHIEGSVRHGFVASNGEAVVKITITSL